MTNEALYVLIVLACVVLTRFIVPVLCKTEKAEIRFGLGALLFVLYTVTMLVAFHWFRLHTGTYGMNAEECFQLLSMTFVLINVVVLFGAFLFFVSREKRKLSETEKMKLKDM